MRYGRIIQIILTIILLISQVFIQNVIIRILTLVALIILFISKTEEFERTDIISYFSDEMIANLTNVSLLIRDTKYMDEEIKQYRNMDRSTLEKYFRENEDKLIFLLKINKLIDINSQTIELFEGNNQKEVIEYASRYEHIDFEDHLLSILNYIFMTNESMIRESYLVTMKGNQKDILVMTHRYCFGSDLLVTMVVDISSINQVRKELNRNEIIFNELIDLAPIGIVVQNNHAITHVNKLLLKMYGVSELIGQKPSKYIPYTERDKMRLTEQKYLLNKKPLMMRSFGKRMDGSIFPIDITTTALKIGNEVYTLSFIKDVTDIIAKEKEEEMAREKLLYTQKLESLGLLAAGISHDFNNQLTSIITGLHLLDMDYDNNKDLINDLLQISNQAADIIKSLLSYTGKSKILSGQIINVKEFIENLTSILKISIAKNIELRFNILEDNIFIKMDESQLSQIIFNIMINAGESIGSKSGLIELKINREIVERIDSSFIHKDLIENSEYAIISISDNGKGIPIDIQNKIFDPFFSDKAKKGRGLGLAVVVGIVFQYKGMLKVISEVGEGSEFRIYLPLSNEAPQIKHKVLNKVKTRNFINTILIIEDEKMIRNLLSKTLKKYKFNVLTAENGLVGLKVFKENTVDLVILDLTMPIMSGEETLKNLKTIDHNLPIIVSSGYSQDETSFNYPNIDYLNKPYSNRQLIQTIERILEL